ncbi:MAG: DUF1993 domain-containing protein [Dokdonella sp.]
MSISMYQASVPVFIRALENLSAILHKAAAHAEAKKIDPSVLVNARLFPDMLPLSRQVQIASDNAKGPAARLAGVERPAFEDNETTFEELQARITKTIAFLKNLTPAQIDGSEERAITVQSPSRELHFKGLPYLLGFALPNFFFHVTTAYAILRASGVELGKPDFIGALPE